MTANESEYSRLMEFSKKLLSYFEHNASVSGVTINKTVRGERDARIAFRIYEEDRADRLIYISPHALPKLDAFVKRTGLESEKFLLQVYTDFDDKKLSTLWEMYIKWIHHGVDKNDVLKYVND